MFEPDTKETGMTEPDTKETGMTEPDKEQTLICLSLTQSQFLFV